MIRYGEQSKAWLRATYDLDAIVVCDVVYAKPIPALRERATLDRALREMNATTSPVDTAMAFEGGIR